MSTSLLSASSPALFERVRSLVIGYCDAALTTTKERLAEELDADAGDVDAILADQFRTERCTCCGHWFDQADCDNDDGLGGFECRDCATN
jgi:hypothetical protein